MSRSLDSAQWRRLEPIFDRALELAGDARSRYLDEACGNDEELRAQVEKMLEADQRSGSFLDGSVENAAADLIEDSSADRTEVLEHGAGSLIGPYEIVRLVGAGGMGVVYEAKDTRLGRRVALKFLPPEYGRDPKAKERFLREARAASALEHPSICNIHDLGETDDGRLYIVMAYYKGETLKQRLRNGPMSHPEAFEIARQLARGLRRAHEAGIVHRDIKPANILLTDSGRPVLLDFGVAKVGGDADLTKAGSTLGTPAYMSPEQARGQTADQRSDLWSLGTVLYEMLAGRRPFEGGDPQTAIFAILNEEPPPLAADVPADKAAVVEKLLSKDRESRYRDAGELLAELGAGDTRTMVAGVVPVRAWRWIAFALGALALVVVAWLFVRPAVELPTTAPTGERPSLAVLFFDNASGDELVDWMRTGIAEMLVTDLAQSPGIEVLSTSRVHQILDELGVLDERQLGLDIVQGIAEAAGVGALVRGSYLRQGEVLQISFSIDDLATGRVLDSGRFQGRGEESLFEVVDELSAAIRDRFEVSISPGLPETIQAVTTDSQEAWRYYTEANDLQRRARDREAIALLEQAVTIDPKFALALVNLGRFHRNIGHAAEARDYLRRALDEREHLPVGVRLEIEASYYGARWATYGLAIDTYQRAIEERPEVGRLRANMANRMVFLERFDEALELFEELIAKDHPYNPMYTTTAWVLAAQGRFERAHAVLSSRLLEAPDDWYNRTGLANLLTVEGRHEEAEEELLKAIQLRPLDQFVQWTVWRLAVMREDWSQASVAADRLADSTDPWELWLGSASQSRIELFRGDGAQALESLARAADAYSEPDAQAAVAHAWAAELLLQLERPAEALRAAQLAIEIGVEEFAELQGLMLASLAHQDLGDAARADEAVDTLKSRWEENPNRVQERQLLHLEGLLALRREDPERAVDLLGQAAAKLPTRGIEVHDHIVPDHVPIWFDLGRAELTAGRPEAALDWFDKVVESGSEHIPHPVPYVRSFYFEGLLHERSGNPELAADAYRRFVGFWRDGDLDRSRVAEALAKATS